MYAPCGQIRVRLVLLASLNPLWACCEAKLLLASPRVDGGVSRNVAARQLITCANRRNHHSSRCRRQLIAETFFCHFERSEPKVNAVEKSQHCVFLRFLRAGYALSRNDNCLHYFRAGKARSSLITPKSNPYLNWCGNMPQLLINSLSFKRGFYYGQNARTRG